MTTELTTCPECGAEFEAMQATFTIAGKPFTFPQKFCPACCDAKTRRLDELAKPSARRKTSWNNLVPPLYRIPFDLDKLPAPSREVARKAFEWRESPRGVGLIGKSRTGKTPIMFELMRRWHEAGKTVLPISSVDFALAVGSIETGVRDSMLERCRAVELLFVDDIGKEKMTDRVESDFYGILDYRRRHLLPVFATVNSSGEELERSMSSDRARPIVNRLRYDLCEFLTVPTN